MAKIGGPGKDGKTGRLRFDGYHSARLVRDAQGNVVKKMLYDQQGHRMLVGNFGHSGWRSTFTPLGLETSRTFLDVDDKPVVRNEGHSGWRSKFDGAGRELERTYLLPDGAPAPTTGGYSGWRSVFDEQGNELQRTYVDVLGRPAYLPSGTSGWRADYDSLGRLRERTELDALGNPHEIEGCATRRSTYDVHEAAVETACFDASGRPAMSDRGYHALVVELDAAGRNVGESYLDKQGQPTLDINGRGGTATVVDGRGRTSSITHLDLDGQPATGPMGWAKLMFENDIRGNVIRAAFWSVNGQALAGADGWHEIRTTYDLQGRETSESYFDVDGEPVPSSDGTLHRIWRRYDHRGNLVSEEAFDVSGERTFAATGCAVHRMVYDAFGRQVERTCHGVDGALIAPPGSPARSVYVRDLGDRVRWEHYFGADGLPAEMDGAGSAGVLRVQALGLQLMRQVDFDATGRPVSGFALTPALGWSFVTWELVPEGLVLKRLASDEPITGPPELVARLVRHVEAWQAGFRTAWTRRAENGLDSPAERGVLVLELPGDGRLEAAGLRVGDVILSVAGKSVRDPERAAKLFVGDEADSLDLDVFREGDTLDVRVLRGPEQPRLEWQ